MNGMIKAPWRRSSGCVGGDCVEVAPLPGGGVAFRNSHDPDGVTLRYTRAEWDAFTDGVRKGEFDDLLDAPEPQRA
jgi:hypothetical protein